MVRVFNKTIKTFTQLENLVNENVQIDRENENTSLIFRPIGQVIFFKVLKAGITNKKAKHVYDYFSKANFSLANNVWKEVFWDEEAGTIITTTERQKFAYHLIMEKIGIPIKRTKKDLEVYSSFGFTINDI